MLVWLCIRASSATHAKASLPLYERSVGFASVQSWSFAVGASCTDFLRPLVSIRA
ncbi:hypothetical protein EUBSIR_00316 [[Eubacterium] siraeum DSM 15702]|uniref:Uncharacterized protein n=1 Tax=[Eubacterium] siraeum DSM 15702 TaxID=428128 RepID=B0MKJ3_9FIRM|nr:hypothetical protein EUBSIR_00316 [[Eubacterium] siraeum DSM 15702]